MSKRRNRVIKSTPFILAIASIVLFAYEYGPNVGYTGAPGDNSTGCQASGCHTSTPNTTLGGSVKITAAGGTNYVPGQTQQIQVTITDSTERKYGFELSARVDSNPGVMGAGTLASTDSNTQVLTCSSATPTNPPFAGSCPSGNTLQWIEHNMTGYTRSAPPATTYSFNWTPPATNVGTVTLYAAGNAGSGALLVNLTHTYLASLQLSPSGGGNPPTIGAGGVVPVDSTVNTIQPGEWVSIYGTNLAAANATWNGDFPQSLGGTSVTVNNKPAYLWFVSPTQINFQSPADTATGLVNVVVTNSAGSATSTATLAQASPSFLLLDSKHVAAYIYRASGPYDVLGPTGTSLGYPTVAAKAGDTVELFGIGFGPTSPAVPPGQLFSGAAATTNQVQVQINGVNITPLFAGLTAAGLYQINVTIPSGLGTGDKPLVATVAGVQTQSNVVVSLQ